MDRESIKAVRQRIYNTVKKHLLKQNQKATDLGGKCRYRSPNGNKCAVGCLIKDEYYTADLEGSSTLIGKKN